MADNSPTPVPDLTDWDTKNRAYDNLAVKLDAINKTVLFDALARAGITCVTVTFDGYGDSGQIENIETRKGDSLTELPDDAIEILEPQWGKDESEIKRATVPLTEAVEIMSYHFLNRSHGGWGDGEGSYGDFVFDVETRAITLGYNAHFVDSVYSETNF
ncbi:MAG: DUF6878 family protein [Methylocystis silviterrae]|uniref:DUF6878 family protein n=1 Tax=Methylocystis silviterrae TaxID=2743612 RepID=UPI003C7762CD